MKEHGISAALAALTLLVACEGSGIGVGTGGGGRPDYAPSGTRIELANLVGGVASTSAITVASASGAEGRYVSDAGETGTYYPGCWGCGGEMVIDLAEYAKLWPLEPGNAVSFTRTAPDGGTAEVTIRVVGEEKIETPAGFFETLILASRIEATSGAPWSAQMRSWWSPALGWVVRSEGSDSNGLSIRSELVRVRPPE